jgi:hypothetical protein
MVIYSDMGSFPESGMPVLRNNCGDICINTLYSKPLKQSGFIIDVVGANRLFGALTLSGALTGVTNITMAGTLATVTNLTMSGTLAMGSGSLLTLGDIGSLLSRINKGWFKNLEITNIPTINGDSLLALVQSSVFPNLLVNGNVGIGTTGPLSKLSINGGLHVGGDSDAGDNNILADGTIAGSNLSGTNTGDNAANSSSTYIGTTQVALNRGTGALTLAGITLTTPNIGVATATGNIAGLPHQLRFTIIDPATVYGKDTQVCLWAKTDAAIHITNIEFRCDADPTTEPTGDIKYADDLISLANPAVIGAFDTTAGSFSSGAINVAVAAGKCIYLQWDTTPDVATTQQTCVIQYDYD